jgi:hypothetical protein
MKRVFLIFFLSLMTAVPVYATADGQMPAPKPASPEFAKIKALAGTWKGETLKGEKKEEVTVNYKISSGGNIVVETIDPGSAHEMTSVYQDGPNGKLRMTHYCMLPNTPVMSLKSSSANSISLELDKKSEIGPKDQHMHALTLTFDGPDKLTQNWSCYTDGKVTEPCVFSLSRA